MWAVCLIWSLDACGRRRVLAMTTNETPSNIELQSAVTAALERSAAVESSLGVSAHEGVVTLSGSVTDAAERAAARAIAQQVPGVNVVSDEIAHPYRGSPAVTTPITPRSRHRKVRSDGAR
jgi:hypothetical protein